MGEVIKVGMADLKTAKAPEYTHDTGVGLLYRINTL